MKLEDEIDFREAMGPDNKLYFSDFEHDDENNKSDEDADSEPTTINKATEYKLNGVEELCKACIESKYTRIVKSKKMTLTTKRVQKVHAVLWGPHKPVSSSKKNYVALLLDEFTRKSWILLLRSKDKFFDAFKLWLPRAEARGNKLDCLQVNGRREFISAALQSFCQKRGIKIGHKALYMLKKTV